MKTRSHRNRLSKTKKIRHKPTTLNGCKPDRIKAIVITHEQKIQDPSASIEVRAFALMEIVGKLIDQTRDV
jgi:hypothetical protein